MILVVLFGQSFWVRATEFANDGKVVSAILLHSVPVVESSALLASFWIQPRLERQSHLVAFMVGVEFVVNVVAFVALYGIATI